MVKLLLPKQVSGVRFSLPAQRKRPPGLFLLRVEQAPQKGACVENRKAEPGPQCVFARGPASSGRSHPVYLEHGEQIYGGELTPILPTRTKKKASWPFSVAGRASTSKRCLRGESKSGARPAVRLRTRTGELGQEPPRIFGAWRTNIRR